MTETVCVTVLAVALTVLINARASEEQQLKHASSICRLRSTEHVVF